MRLITFEEVQIVSGGRGVEAGLCDSGEGDGSGGGYDGYCYVLDSFENYVSNWGSSGGSGLSSAETIQVVEIVGQRTAELKNETVANLSCEIIGVAVGAMGALLTIETGFGPALSFAAGRAITNLCKDYVHDRIYH